MKIVLTGSLGRIGKRLAQTLIQRGHAVTVISSNAEKRADIEALGGKAAIGSMTDAKFLTETFSGADVVYLMEPPFDFFDKEKTPGELWLEIAQSYLQAVRHSGVTQAIHLSSIGAHASEGVGMLNAHCFVEEILRQLPESVAVKTLRPVGFYYNMFAFIPMIKQAGAIFSNYGGDEKEPWVSPDDIADAIAEATELPFAGRTIRYIASDEISPNGLAQAIGEAIGMRGLEWKVVSDEQRLESLLGIGMNPAAAQGIVEMDAARRGGKLYEDFNRNRPAFGKTKIREFLADFARAYAGQ